MPPVDTLAPNLSSPGPRLAGLSLGILRNQRSGERILELAVADWVFASRLDHSVQCRSLDRRISRRG